MVTAILLAGAAVGTGAWLIVLGLRPRRVSLAEALAALDQPARAVSAAAPARRRDGWEVVGGRAVGLLRRLVPAVTAQATGALAQDLHVLQRSADSHVCQKVVTAVVGLVLPDLVAGALAVAGIPVPWSPPLLMSLLCMAAGYVVPDGAVRTEARARRDQEFLPALAAFLDLVSVSLAAGAGIEEALVDAARTGRGWAFTEIARALEATRYTSETPWQALGRLGDELGVEELREISASVGLAGQEGAPVRRSLAARAEAMRAQRLSAVDSAARRATDLMSFPVVLLALAFMAFLAFPSLARVLGT